MSQTIVTPSVLTDRTRIYDILMRSEIFGKVDADCVDEMFMQAMNKPAPDQYQFLSCRVNDEMVGFACYGMEALTHGTWDLFWVCALPHARGHGVGGALLRAAVNGARAGGGRLMVIYTSSTEAYVPARKLYESQGFTRAATVDDYYNDHDSLFIYSKRLS